MPPISPCAYAQDHLHQPYISNMRDAAGNLFPVAWVLIPDGKFPPFPTAFGSWLYNPMGKLADVEIGEQVTEELVWSPYKSVPSRVCRDCYVGDSEWFLGDWPDGTPPVAMNPDGFAENCGGPCMDCLKSVGLAAANTFIVTGSPVTSRGTISLDWVDVPAGYALMGPTSGPDAKPTFKPLPSGSVTITGDSYITVTEPTTGNFFLTLTSVDYTLVTPGYPGSNLGAGTIPSGVLLPPANLDTGTIPSGVLLPPANLDTGTIPTTTLLDPASLTAGAIPSGTTLDWSQLTSVPTFPTTDGNTVAITTTASFVTVLNLTATNGLIGTARLIGANAGLNSYDWKVTVTDQRQGTQTYTGNGVNANLNTIGFIYNFDTSANGFTGNGLTSNTAPITAFKVEVRFSSGWTPSNLRLDYVSVAL